MAEKMRKIDEVLNSGIKTIGIMTGGGDCPGLNAVIRSVVLMAKKYGVKVKGIPYGYRGMYLGEKYYVDLDEMDVEDIIEKGGTILHSSNKDNLFKYPRRDKNGLMHDENNNLIYDNFSEQALENVEKAGIDALIIVGGDGTLTSGRDYSRMGIPVVGVPKTIDNDLRSTEVTFGFDTAVARCSDAISSIRTTGEAHSRVMLVEVMGRNAGHIALHTAIASAADMVLISEIPYDSKKIVEDVRHSLEKKGNAIVVVSEGVKAPVEGSMKTKIVEGSPDAVRFGGISGVIADYLERELNSSRDSNGYAINDIIIDVECRATNLGYVQRGGVPTPNDRILSTRFGAFAVKVLMEDLKPDANGNFGKMVSMQNNQLTAVDLEDVINSATMIDNQRRVDPDGELVNLARDMGISFGDVK